jgi:hypothetical protein
MQTAHKSDCKITRRWHIYCAVALLLCKYVENSKENADNHGQGLTPTVFATVIAISRGGHPTSFIEKAAEVVKHFKYKANNKGWET